MFSFVFLVLYVLWWRSRREKSTTRRVESSSRLHRVHDREKDPSWWPSWDWFKWSETVSGVCKVRWLFDQFGSHIEIPWQTAAFVHNQNGGLHHGRRSSVQSGNFEFFDAIVFTVFFIEVQMSIRRSRWFFAYNSLVLFSMKLKKQNFALFPTNKRLSSATKLGSFTAVRRLFEQILVSFASRCTIIYLLTVILAIHKFWFSYFSR